MLCWPSDTTPATGTGHAAFTCVSSVARSARRRRQQAPGQQDLARQAVADDPQDLVPDVRLQPVDGQDHPRLVGQHGPQPGVVGEGDGEQFVVPVEQVGDGPFGDADAAAVQVGADLGDRAVLAVAEVADEGDDVESELVVREGEAALGLGAVRSADGRTGVVAAAADGQVQAGDAVQGGEGTAVDVVGPQEGRRSAAQAVRSGDNAWVRVGSEGRAVLGMTNPLE